MYKRPFWLGRATLKHSPSLVPASYVLRPASCVATSCSVAFPNNGKARPQQTFCVCATRNGEGMINECAGQPAGGLEQEEKKEEEREEEEEEEDAGRPQPRKK